MFGYIPAFYIYRMRRTCYSWVSPCKFTFSPAPHALSAGYCATKKAGWPFALPSWITIIYIRGYPAPAPPIIYPCPWKEPPAIMIYGSGRSSLCWPLPLFLFKMLKLFLLTYILGLSSITSPLARWRRRRIIATSVPMQKQQMQMERRVHIQAARALLVPTSVHFPLVQSLL